MEPITYVNKQNLELYDERLKGYLFENYTPTKNIFASDVYDIDINEFHIEQNARDLSYNINIDVPEPEEGMEEEFVVEFEDVWHSTEASNYILPAGNYVFSILDLSNTTEDGPLLGIGNDDGMLFAVNVGKENSYTVKEDTLLNCFFYNLSEFSKKEIYSLKIGIMIRKDTDLDPSYVPYKITSLSNMQMYAQDVKVDDEIVKLGAINVSDALVKLKNTSNDLTRKLNDRIIYDSDSEYVSITMPEVSASYDESSEIITIDTGA